MLNPGTITLSRNGVNSALQLGAAGETICDTIENIAGALGLTLFGLFTHTGGGTACKAFVQTRFGSVWVDLACFAFATSSGVKGHNLSFQTPKTLFPVTDGGLADDTIVDGPIGDALRCKVVVSGSYNAGTLLAVSGQIR